MDRRMATACDTCPGEDGMRVVADRNVTADNHRCLSFVMLASPIIVRAVVMKKNLREFFKSLLHKGLRSTFIPKTQ
jgi:hypothetical protein